MSSPYDFDRSTLRGDGRRFGFTLIEIVVVIAIVAVLAAIVLNVSAGVQRRAAVDRVQAELAVLDAGLEAYRRVFGSYPQMSGGAVLLAALNGRAGPTGGAIVQAPIVLLAAFTLREDDPAAPGNVLLDPWDQPYVYQPYTSGPRRSYRLYSIGPDGRDQPATSAGGIDENDPANLDNIYAHL
ncbi:MAG: type II secretion system protein GspG [Candidatus Synoicihabitans palmerolidicus]|nr:type II secretion system protein GspG [Candidatus Synoicihabitans palmerolidicus]